MQRPSVWLLDEPHAALDVEGKQTVDALITEATKAGATVLVASHEIDKVGQNETRIIEVAGGAVISDTGENIGGENNVS